MCEVGKDGVVPTNGPEGDDDAFSKSARVAVSFVTVFTALFLTSTRGKKIVKTCQRETFHKPNSELTQFFQVVHTLIHSTAAAAHN